MIRRILAVIEGWAMDSDQPALLSVAKMMFVVGVPLSVLFALMIWWLASAQRSEMHECLTRGDGWAIIGTHRGAKGDTVTDYGCVPLRRS